MGRQSRGRAAPAPSKSSSSSSGSGWGASSSKPSNPPPQQYHAPPPAPMMQQQSGGMMSGLAGTVMQGMALGTGSALAHEAVHSIFRGGSSGHATPKEAVQEVRQQMEPQDPCFNQQKAFLDCLQNNNYDQGACEYWLQTFQQCKIRTGGQQSAFQ